MKRTIGWFVFGLLIVAGLVLLFGRERIGHIAFNRALDQNAGVDRAATLSDGLHAYVCGSGSPFPDEGRAGPCIAVVAGDQAFVFDAGSGSVRKLLRMGFPVERMRAVFLTHLHSDHIDGLGEVMLQAWINGGRPEPLPVFGPDGTDRVVGGFLAAYEPDRDFRIAHHGPSIANPKGYGAVALSSTLADVGQAMVAYNEGGVKVAVFPVDHAPVSPAFGYRIDYKGRSITISGDTIYAPSLVQAAKGSDVLFHDAMSMEMVGAIGKKLGERGRNTQAQIMADIQEYHASPADAARAAQESGAKALVLYHLVPPLPSALVEPVFLGDAPKAFSGTLKIARDGMMVSLPAGSKAVEFSQAF